MEQITPFLFNKAQVEYPEPLRFPLKWFSAEIVELLKPLAQHDDQYLVLQFQNGSPRVIGNGRELEPESRDRLFSALKNFRDLFSDKNLTADFVFSMKKGGGLDQTRYRLNGRNFILTDAGVPLLFPK